MVERQEGAEVAESARRVRVALCAACTGAVFGACSVSDDKYLADSNDEFSLLAADFNGRPDTDCALDANCATAEGCSGGARVGMRHSSGECPSVFCTVASSAGCVDYREEQVGQSLTLSATLAVPERDALPNRAWLGYSVPLGGPGEALDLSADRDCLSFLVDPVELPNDVLLEIALKEKALRGRCPVETFPKRQLARYARNRPGWCEARIPVADLTREGAEDATCGDLKSPVDRTRLGEVNFLLTTSLEGSPGTVFDVRIGIDEIGFVRCNDAHRGAMACVPP